MINNYNEIIENKEYLINLFSKVYNLYIENNGEIIVTKVKTVKIESDKDPSSRNVHGYMYRITLSILVKENKSKNSNIQYLEFYLPKMYNNAFYYKRPSDEKILERLPITIMHNQDNIKVVRNNIIMNLNDFNIRLEIRNMNNEFPFYLRFKESGEELELKTPHEVVENIIARKGESGLTLDERYMKKLKMLGFNNDILDLSLLNTFVTMSEDDRKDLDIKTPYDYKYNGYLDYLQNLIQMNSFSLQNKLRSMFRRYGKLYTSVVQQIINRSLSIGEGNIQIGDDNNPLSNLTRTNRLVFKGSGQYEDNRLIYNKYFYGFICPVTTPDNANTSIHNEIAQSSYIKDGKPYVKLINLQTGKAEWVESYVLFSEPILYPEEDLKKKGPYKCLVKMEDKLIDDYKNIKYKLSDPDDYLSLNNAIIPFSNSSDTQRIAGATKNIDQSISCIGSQPSIIYTGAESKIFEMSDEKIESPVSGKITDIKRKDTTYTITIDDEHKVIFENEYMSSYNSYNQLVPLVKVGDKVKKGQIIVASNSFKDGEFATGLNLYSAFTEMQGLTYREGIVISESCAKKLGHETLYTFEYNFNTEWCYFDKEYVDLVKSNFTLNNFEVNENDINKRYFIQSEGKIVSRYLGGYLKFKVTKMGYTDDEDEQLPYTETIKLPPHVNNGEILSCELILVEEGNKFYNESLECLVGTVVRKNKVTYTDYIDKGISGKLIFKIKYINVATELDKISTKYYNKGLSTKVVPDDEFYKDKDGRTIDIVFGALSIPSRKTISLPQESLLGKCCVRGYEIVDNLLKNKKYKEVKEIFSLLFMNDSFKDYTEKELIDYHNSFSKYKFYRVKVSCWNTKYNNEYIMKIAEKLGIESDEYLTLNGRKVRNKIVTGYTYTYRLHFLSEDLGTATPTQNLLNETTFFQGIGKTSTSGGASIGELQIFGLLANGAKEVYDEITEYKREENLSELNEVLLSLGLTIKPTEE